MKVLSEILVSIQLISAAPLIVTVLIVPFSEVVLEPLELEVFDGELELTVGVEDFVDVREEVEVGGGGGEEEEGAEVAFECVLSLSLFLPSRAKNRLPQRARDYKFPPLFFEIYNFYIVCSSITHTKVF